MKANTWLTLSSPCKKVLDQFITFHTVLQEQWQWQTLNLPTPMGVDNNLRVSNKSGNLETTYTIITSVSFHKTFVLRLAHSKLTLIRSSLGILYMQILAKSSKFLNAKCEFERSK